MALANNFLELRSDAFKISVHSRRPIPARSDTIGPWLGVLTFLTWLSALTNSALVYLFRPRQSLMREQPVSQGNADTANQRTRWLVFTAILIALASSHGYLLLRVLVRHIAERLVWNGSREVQEWESNERAVKERCLAILERENSFARVHAAVGDDGDVDELDGDGFDGGGDDAFWQFDEGLEEIRRIGKPA